MLNKKKSIFKPDLSGPLTAKSLRLNLQHFAEGDPPPPKHDGYYATLKELFKANPHLHTEHKQAITDAVSDRFKKYDFDADEAKAALAEKKQREEDKAAGRDTESQELKTAKERATKLEAKTKKLALDSLTGDAEQSKLISRLAADKVADLKLNDEFELDKAAVDAIVEELRGEFPTLFPADPNTPDPNQQTDPNNPPPPPPPAGTRASGGTPGTNNPPKPNANVEADVADILKRLTDTNRI